MANIFVVILESRCRKSLPFCRTSTAFPSSRQCLTVAVLVKVPRDSNARIVMMFKAVQVNSEPLSTRRPSPVPLAPASRLPFRCPIALMPHRLMRRTARGVDAVCVFPRVFLFCVQGRPATESRTHCPSGGRRAGAERPGGEGCAGHARDQPGRPGMQQR